jgi:hypothetical protein
MKKEIVEKKFVGKNFVSWNFVPMAVAGCVAFFCLTCCWSKGLAQTWEEACRSGNIEIEVPPGQECKYAKKALRSRFEQAASARFDIVMRSGRLKRSCKKCQEWMRNSQPAIEKFLVSNISEKSKVCAKVHRLAGVYDIDVLAYKLELREIEGDRQKIEHLCDKENYEEACELILSEERKRELLIENWRRRWEL